MFNSSAVLAAFLGMTLSLPTGKVAGRLQVPPQEATPGIVQVRFESAPQTKPVIPPTTMICPVRDKLWECALPSGSLDLRVQADGFVPRYFWGIAVTPDRRADLGALDLKRGASLIGWVELGGSGTPTIEVTPFLLGGNTAWAESGRVRQRAFTGQANERGFFQVTGLPAGEYVATARLDGLAPAQSEPLTLYAGAETRLPRPLLLEPPPFLDVHLSPATDPQGEAWRLELLEGGASWPPQRLRPAGGGAADPTGAWRREGLITGHYMLLIRDAAGSEWYRDWIEAETGMPPLDLALDVVEVAGKIQRGDEPFETTFWLERERDAGQRIRFASDSKGRFSGFLPAEGEWGVDLRLSRDGVQALEPVQVKRLPGKKLARVEIRIPNTRLSIQVRDENGAPAAEAEVTILSSPEKKRREAQGRTDRRGELALEGIVPGVVQLHARKDRSSSDWAVLTVTEDAETTPVELVLREKLRLTGQVVSPESPVAGALVTAFPHSSEGSRAWVGRAVSGADGAFELELDRSFPGGSLAIFAPGFAVRLMPMPTGWREGERLTIPVRQESGEVLVDLDGLGEDSLNRSRLRHSGGQLPLAPFLREGMAQRVEPRKVRVPRLEPGEYSLCPEAASPAGACAHGFLSSNGRLELRVPAASNPQGDSR
jgi:hypothetical protein